MADFQDVFTALGEKRFNDVKKLLCDDLKMHKSTNAYHDEAVYNEWVYDINTTTIYGETLLHLLCKPEKYPCRAKDVNKTMRKHNKEIMEIVLSYPDVDVNAQDLFGTTPLHCAIIAGNLDVVNMLLKRKDIDISKVDAANNNAFALARIHNKKRILAVIRDYIQKQANAKRIIMNTQRQH